MGKFLMGTGFVLLSIMWLWTSWVMFLAYGPVWGLIALFFPPADLIAMFVLGTWPLGLAGIGLLGLGSVIESWKDA